MARTIDLATHEQEFTTLLQSYIQSGKINFLIGSGASMPAIQAASNIEQQINALLLEKKEKQANLRALEFIEELSEKNSSLGQGTGTVEVTGTVEAYTKFITIVDSILFERKNLLLPRQANIFTTNYDMFVEYAARKIPSLILNDGFVRAAGTNTDYPFAPERYSDRTYRSGAVYSHLSEVPTINLIKLHGSLSWRNNGNSIVYDSRPFTPLSASEKNDDKTVAKRLEEFFLILPNLRKFHATMMDRVYYDLLRIFANAMDQENAVLMVFGFSFEDEHILDITRRALRNPTAQLLIFAYDHATVAAFEQKFAIHRNAVVISPKAGEFTDFSQLTGLLTNAVHA